MENESIVIRINTKYIFGSTFVRIESYGALSYLQKMRLVIQIFVYLLRGMVSVSYTHLTLPTICSV